MMQPTIEIYATPHPGQLTVHSSPARFRILSAGRRWGKTRLGVNECLDVAAHGGRAWWVSPSYKTGEVGWRPLRQMATRIGAEVNRTERRVTLPNGGEVTVRSGDNPDALRGEGLDFCVLDECAFMAEEVWTEAIRPALSDRQGKALFISTPKGRNFFWRLHQQGMTGAPDFAAWTFPTSSNPYIPPAEIEAARATLPETIFEQEYLAVFLESAGAVFRNLPVCLTLAKGEVSAHAGHTITAGVDWGKQSDFTAISIGCADCHVELDTDRSNQVDYHVQRQRLQALAKRWGVTTILAESNAMGAPIIEELQRSGLPVVAFETTATTKPPLIENLALALERAEWKFLADPVWRAELEAYERIVSPVTGRSSYSAPVGLHDDTVIARALMLFAANAVQGHRPDEIIYAPVQIGPQW